MKLPENISHSRRIRFFRKLLSLSHHEVKRVRAEKGPDHAHAGRIRFIGKDCKADAPFL